MHVLTFVIVSIASLFFFIFITHVVILIHLIFVIFMIAPIIENIIEISDHLLVLFLIGCSQHLIKLAMFNLGPYKVRFLLN